MNDEEIALTLWVFYTETKTEIPDKLFFTTSFFFQDNTVTLAGKVNRIKHSFKCSANVSFPA